MTSQDRGRITAIVLCMLSFIVGAYSVDLLHHRKARLYPLTWESEWCSSCVKNLASARAESLNLHTQVVSAETRLHDCQTLASEVGATNDKLFTIVDNLDHGSTKSQNLLLFLRQVGIESLRKRDTEAWKDCEQFSKRWYMPTTVPHWRAEGTANRCSWAWVQ